MFGFRKPELPHTAIHRRVLLAFPNGAQPTFTVERWFIPLDAEVESIVHAALIWHGHGEEDRVVLLGPSAVDMVRLALQDLGTDDPPIAERVT